MAAPAAAFAAASAAVPPAAEALAVGSEAIDGAGIAVAGAGAGAGAGDAAGAASSFLPQADRATAATREANKSDFFI
jgi:hypothetical protein